MADFEGTKELNLDENVSLEELGRLRLENRDLQLAREKLVKKLDKKKNELEIEKTNAITLRQLIQELNRKVELLEREPIPVISPLRIDPGAGLTGEVVERLVMEKTGLESNLAEQKTEIETLKSEITSMDTKIVLTNQSLEIARGENARFEKLVPELKLELSKKENECKRLSMSTNNADETNETETLKTRLQDLSITNNHYLSQLQNKLDESQYEVTELLRKCNSLQKSKNEIEDTLQTELKESRDEVFLLKTETNQQKETINKQNEVIETYKQQQISEEYKASETKDRLMSRYHYPFQSPASLPTHSIGLNTKPPVIEQPWKCLFCGATYPSERERDIHMTDSCNNAPTRDDQSIVTQHRPPMGRPPMMKAHSPLDNLPYRPPFQQRERQLESPQAALMELTPKLIPQANKTGKSPSKISFRGTSIYVIKLKACPNPTESYNKQVIYSINKHYELGVLMCIAEVQTKVGFWEVLYKYAGIKLYNPVGNCDGAYKDKRYFDCPPNCGIFVPIEDVNIPVP